MDLNGKPLNDDASASSFLDRFHETFEPDIDIPTPERILRLARSHAEVALSKMGAVLTARARTNYAYDLLLAAAHLAERRSEPFVLESLVYALLFEQDPHQTSNKYVGRTTQKHE